MDAEICSKIYGFTQLSDFKDFKDNFSQSKSKSRSHFYRLVGVLR